MFIFLFFPSNSRTRNKVMYFSFSYFLFSSKLSIFSFLSFSKLGNTALVTNNHNM
ncbi:hypothetical protein HanXRQr2_Chr07g0294431 [Helianthus annuus]|uniref:Uncharacterized protein n=1 Tax=Helianthus annuus TaxID=4232 RepID=A0A9K3IKE1_HELAN|nr:hypothetical protein HanXRQr2_Chr07g0294431 [Helianthus annuus]KAJ0556770.1 hypothetical protein HanIR_Chr07g0317621 [Helianthus annuus]KAJ0904677.1 hypothetical protein HanPSC8_Chr07g0285061 [Helianthus annuus]